MPLGGEWKFKFDPDGRGEAERWFLASAPAEGWNDVTVPHTWQISASSADYMGVAWYRRTFEVDPSWAEKAVRVEFEAVYHSATVWLNGRPVGQHLRKGYTAFTLDLTSALKAGTHG